jgi:hypothetical protein
MTTNGKTKKPERKLRSKTAEEVAPIKTKADLKAFLLNVRDRMTDETAAPIYAVTAINAVLGNENAYELLNKENKEIARDIWLRIRQSGFHMDNPRMLFGEDEEVGVSQME